MTTSGSIWLSVGRVMAQRKTETTVGTKKTKQQKKRRKICMTVVGGFLFSILEFHFFFVSCNKANECGGTAVSAHSHSALVSNQTSESIHLQQRIK